MVRRTACAAFVGLLSILCAGGAAPGGCPEDWVDAAFGRDARSPRPDGAVLIEDLAALRDLGPISLSPDGRWLAFSVRQAVLDQDRYAVRWFVAPVDGRGPPRAMADEAGEPLIDFMYGLPYASITAERAGWSPDGEHIAYRRRIGDRIGLVVARRTDGSIREIDDGAVNVEAFAWLPGGELIYRTGLDVAAFERSVAEEARSGWLMDARQPLFAARAPAPTRPDCRSGSAPSCQGLIFVAAVDGFRRPAESEEVAVFRRLLDEPRPNPIRPGSNVRLVGIAGHGGQAWAEVVDPKANGAATPMLRIAMRIAMRGAHEAICAAAACQGAFIRAVGMSFDGNAVWFVKSTSGEGRADDLPRDETGVYLWRPTERSVRRLLRTEAQIEGCVAADGRLICSAQAPTQPSRIIAIDLATGRRSTLADPNPHFATKRYPRVRKIYISDQEGRPAFAHVVYPLNYRAGVRYPLVVTQYDSRGFLRGQVGDAHAIFDLSAHGYFVLSVDRPEDWAGLRTLDTVSVYRRGLGPGLPDRLSAFQANEAAVDRLVREGLVDPQRIGITGVSAGAENVHYTLQNTGRYAAAVADSGSHDLSFMALVPAGKRRETLLRMFSMSSLSSTSGDALSELAWSNKPDRLQTPLLITAGANQALIGFEGVQALAAAGRPIEMRVFPDEMHILYRPQTIVAAQRLNRAWLEFWLQGREDLQGAGQGQFARWRAMRAQLRGEAAAGARSSPGSRARSSGM